MISGTTPVENATMSHAVRSRFVERADIIRILVGWATFAALVIAAPLLEPPVPGAALVMVLAAIVAVIIVCAFGVLKQAEALAHRLGDPYGSLVLTLSIVAIEVILIAAVMLGPGKHTTIARDSVMAVAMIILNLVVGLALVVGGIRRGGLRTNRAGTSAYLSMLIPLVGVAFALPAAIGDGGAFTVGQEVPIIVVTLALYVFFLVRQMGPQAGDFREPDAAPAGTDADAAPVRGAGSAPAAQRAPIGETLRSHRREVVTRLLVLLATAVPIVLLSHDMAELLDDGLGRIGAPVALAGVLIAAIVFLPETLTTLRAAARGEGQRVSNLCHGALVSSVGTTIPVVLIIGMITGQAVVLAESPANLLLLAMTMLLTVTTFGARRVTAMHGAAHLALFAFYAVTLFG